MVSMINKRLNSTSGKMIKELKPLNVSPTIKATRWVLLFSGFLYGIMKLNILRELEKNLSVEREKKLHEKLARKAEESRNITKKELESVAREFGVTDFPPGWEDGI